MIEGAPSKAFTKVKRWMYEWPKEFKELIEILTGVLSVFLIN
jgi:uroporphyrinogen-III decarboxylase